jgi:hypothetical protein
MCSIENRNNQPRNIHLENYRPKLIYMKKIHPKLICSDDRNDSNKADEVKSDMIGVKSKRKTDNYICSIGVKFDQIKKEEVIIN